MIFVIDGVYQNPDKPKIMIFTKNGQVRITRTNISNSFKTNVNSDVGKKDIESFIDFLTSTDSDVLRAVASFIYTANIT